MIYIGLGKNINSFRICLGWHDKFTSCKNFCEPTPQENIISTEIKPDPRLLKKKHSRGAVVVFTILFLDVLRRVRCGIRGSAWDVHSKCLVSDNRRLFWPKSSSELFVSCILSHRFGILINTDLTWKYHAHNISTQSTTMFSKYIVLVHTLSVYVRMCEWVFNIIARTNKPSLALQCRHWSCDWTTSTMVGSGESMSHEWKLSLMKRPRMTVRRECVTCHLPESVLRCPGIQQGF